MTKLIYRGNSYDSDNKPAARTSGGESKGSLLYRGYTQPKTKAADIAAPGPQGQKQKMRYRGFSL